MQNFFITVPLSGSAPIWSDHKSGPRLVAFAFPSTVLPIFPSLLSIFSFLFLIFPPLVLFHPFQMQGKEEDNGPQMGPKPTAHVTFVFFAMQVETYYSINFKKYL